MHNIQDAGKAQAPLQLNDEDGLLRKQKGAVWIKPATEDLHLELYDIAHASAALNYAVKETRSRLKEVLFWNISR